MPAASWKGSIKFGPLVQFPVRAVAVDREIKFGFNLHHGVDGGRLRLGESICEICGEAVPRSATVKGYQGVPGIDTEYLASLEAEKSSVLELDGLVPASQIEPRQYRRSYDVIADKGGEKTAALFLYLLESENLVAVGKVVSGGQEQIVSMRARDGALAMELLWWPEELKGDAEARASIEGVTLTDGEKALGRQLVQLMARDFDPTAYRNEYKATVAEYLASFVAGKEPVKFEARPVQSAPVMSLEDALAASLAAMGGEKAAAA